MSKRTRQRIIIGLIIVAIAGAAAYFFRDRLFGNRNKRTEEDPDKDRPIIIRTDGAITNQPFDVYYDLRFTPHGNPNQLSFRGPELYSLVVTDRASKEPIEYSRLKPDCEVAITLSPGTPDAKVTVYGYTSAAMVIEFNGLKPGDWNTCSGCKVAKVTCNCCTGKPLEEWKPKPSQAPVSVILHR